MGISTRQEQYRKYLKSNDWKRKRLKKRSRRDRCAICGDTRHLDVHHLNYRNWTDVTMSDLRVLCRRCHELAHDLLRRGVIVYRSENHHHRFVVTKNALHRYLRPEDMHWPAGPEPRERLVPGGGYTRDQLAAWGVPWPPPKGWRKKLIAEGRVPAVIDYPDEVCGFRGDNRFEPLWGAK